jgi:sugar phosphate isomerase/epimerase
VELSSRELRGLDRPALVGLRDELQRSGLEVAVISSAAEDGDEWQQEALAPAFDLAGFFRARGVLTYAPPAGGGSGLDAGRLAGWLETASALAARQQITLLLCNRPRTWADTGKRFNQLLARIEAPWVEAAFDPVGFVALREHPFLVSFMPGHLKSRLRWLRICDATFETGAEVALNEGNAEIKELVSAVLARGFDGFFSVHPHQQDAGPAAIHAALAEFWRLLDSLGEANGGHRGIGDGENGW